MADQAISFVADSGYFDHARYFLVNCRRQGGWAGDFCMLSPQSCDTSDFERRGIDVFRVPDEAWSFLTKFWIFDPYFRKWEHVLCCDLDVMVQGPLQKVFDGLAPRTPKILCDMEDKPILMGFQTWDDHFDEHPDRYAELAAQYPHINSRMFNMAFVFYQPDSIEDDMRQKLLDVHEQYADLNPTMADQMIVNLHLYDRMEEAGKDYWTFMGHDWPCNRVSSDYRGWTGNEEPVLLHYTRWMAPWIVKYPPDEAAAKPLRELGLPEETGGYQNHRLGRVCHDLYAECLAAFDEEFPVL